MPITGPARNKPSGTAGKVRIAGRNRSRYYTLSGATTDVPDTMPPNVLVVDDSSLQRTIVSGALSDRFEVVGEAENGREAVELFESLEPDLVTMDIMMPEMDGVEATGRIKSAADGTKVMMCTSVEQAEKMKEAVRAGADEYVTKPFDESELLDTATALLQ